MRDHTPFMGPYKDILKPYGSQNEIDPKIGFLNLDDVHKDETHLRKIAENTEDSKITLDDLKSFAEKSATDIESIKRQFQAEIESRKAADIENRRYTTRWNIISTAIAFVSLAVAAVSLIIQFTS